MEYKKRTPLIFVLSGKARSGKDCVASYLKQYYQNKKVIKVSYAYYLKEYVKKISTWDGSEDTKPRSLLQEFGISFLKEKIDPYLLIRRVIEDIKVYSYFYDVIIITDARLKEEIEIPKQKFEHVISIYIENPKGNNLSNEEKRHITETDLDHYQNFDYKIIYEEETIKKQIEKIMEDIDEK